MGDPQRFRAPGTWLVITVIAMATLGVTWLRWHRVPVALSADAIFPLPDMRLDLNAASEAELTVLPGIGPRLAERIVTERLAAGPFATVDSLTRVGGVGPATVDRIRPYVVAELGSPQNSTPVSPQSPASGGR